MAVNHAQLYTAPAQSNKPVSNSVQFPLSKILNAFLNKHVLSLVLKAFNNKQSLSEFGRLFLSVGPEAAELRGRSETSDTD